MTKVNLVAPLNQLGFGIFSVIYYTALKQEGFEVNWEMIGNSDPVSIKQIVEDYGLDMSELLKDLSRPLDPDCKTLTIWHPNQIKKTDVGTEQIGITHFETTLLKADEIAQLKSMDQIYVCSEWGRKVLEDHGITSNGVCPGVSATHSLKEHNPEHSKMRGKLDKAFDSKVGDRRLILASAGKWETRKDQEKIIEAIELTSSGNVYLVAFWNNIFTGGLTQPLEHMTSRGWTIVEKMCPIGSSGTGYILQYNGENKKILLMPFMDSQIRLNNFINAADAYISISRGEGWDQPLVDAMGMGMLCVVSYNTAHTEYINGKNAIVIPCNRELAVDKIWFDGSKGDWYPITDIMDLIVELERLKEDAFTDNYTEFCQEAQATISRISNSIPGFLNQRLR